jgi:S-adenosylmethionine hydrolase
MLHGKDIEVKLGNRKIKGLAPNYTSIPKGHTAPVLGSLGYLEIVGNAESAQRLLKVGIGSNVELKFL